MKKQTKSPDESPMKNTRPHDVDTSKPQHADLEQAQHDLTGPSDKASPIKGEQPEALPEDLHEATHEDTKHEATQKQEMQSLKEQIEALSVALDEEKKRSLNSLANLENTRRRLEKDKQDAMRFAASAFMKDIVVVADNFFRALEAAGDGKEITPQMWQGVTMTARELQSTFARHHLIRIAPKPGDFFDYQFHQAIGHEESNTYQEGSVVKVLQDGYRLHDRLLRPATVMIASAPRKPDTDSPTKEGDSHKPVDQEV